MSEMTGVTITHFPFHTSHARIPGDKAGRVMAGMHNRWHFLQLLGCRFVIMWPARERAEGGRLPRRPSRRVA